MELSIQERLKDLREAHKDDFFSAPEDNLIIINQIRRIAV